MLMIGRVFSHPFSASGNHYQQAGLLAFGLLAVSGVAWLALHRQRPSPEAIEQARRERLSRTGRLTDGSLVDTTTLDGAFLGQATNFQGRTDTPQMLLFRYRIAGVVYEAVQDVSMLTDRVRGLRIDLPIQVRYDHHNPADSIVVSEEWSGLRTTDSEGGHTPTPLPIAGA